MVMTIAFANPPGEFASNGMSARTSSPVTTSKFRPVLRDVRARSDRAPLATWNDLRVEVRRSEPCDLRAASVHRTVDRRSAGDEDFGTLCLIRTGHLGEDVS